MSILLNGSKIRIWRDNWIPRGDLRPQTRLEKEDTGGSHT
jgi:hypothetical protein